MGHFEDYMGSRKPNCHCDNCELEKRFGGWTFSCDAVCMLCRKRFSEHNGYHCPEKKEWKLRCGARVVVNKNGFEFEILTGDAPGVVNFTEIPELIKILEEIGGKDEK